MTYALNQWQALCRYTEDGRLTIDNNVSERRLRDQAIGRKNWMFLGSAEAGPRAAVICTILAGAKRHRLEPWAYLRDVIMQLSVDASPESLTRLLPDRWAQAHPEHVLSYRLEESREKAQRRDQRRGADTSQPDSQRGAIAQPLWQGLASGAVPWSLRGSWLYRPDGGQRCQPQASRPRRTIASRCRVRGGSMYPGRLRGPRRWVLVLGAYVAVGTVGPVWH